MTFALPSLLAQTHDWGAFVFFASWCVVALLYVYLLVPEIAGLSVEEIEDVFRGPWTVVGRRRQELAREELSRRNNNTSFDLDRDSTVDR